MVSVLLLYHMNNQKNKKNIKKYLVVSKKSIKFVFLIDAGKERGEQESGEGVKE